VWLATTLADFEINDIAGGLPEEAVDETKAPNPISLSVADKFEPVVRPDA
jgi:hypothetical protein